LTADSKNMTAGQTFLGVLFSLLYCLALQRAIEYFLKWFKSTRCKIRPYCFLLQIHCFSIAKAIAFHCYFKRIFSINSG
jgi:hypothetical protein